MQVNTERPWFQHWPKAVPQSIQYPEISLGDMLRRAVDEAPDETAITYLGSRLTYKEIDSLVDKFAAALQSLNVTKGDRVALYLPNIPQFIIAYFGILRTGAVVVAASPLYKKRELSDILQDSGAEVIVAWDNLYPTVRAVKESISLRHVVTTSLRDYLPTASRFFSQLKGVRSYPTPGADDMQLLIMKPRKPAKPVKINPKEDTALLQYTGGTTGNPKGAVLTHYKLVVNAAQFATWLSMRPGHEVHLAVLPFYHIYGMTAAMNAPIYTWSTIVLMPDPRDLSNILKAVDRNKPTILCGIPTTYITILEQRDVQKHDFQSIRACVSGASPLPVEVQRKFEILTGGRLVEGYGLTEASPVTHVNPIEPSKNRPGSIGIPISDTDAKIVDLDKGEKDMPPGKIGELVVRGPQVMSCYWNNPDETKMVLRSGWLYTGDIATMDHDGYFHIIDRKKDMINVSGLKVWPKEVEEVLYEHPAIKEAAVVGLPDSRSGEAVKAFVVLKEGHQTKVTAEEITKFCRERMAPYKAPQVVDIRDTLPKTPVGKILRRELRTSSTA
jgi:long-chain acyl-CoA synthetase